MLSHLEMEEKLGKSNHGVVYAVYSFTAQNDDELSFSSGEKLTVLRKGDDVESLWWYSRFQKKEGYVPRNYLGVSRFFFPFLPFRKAALLANILANIFNG